MPSGGYATRAQFKKVQLDHLIDVILEADGDADDDYHHIANEYLARNVQDYINIKKDELDRMIITKTETNDPIDIPNTMKKCILVLKGFWSKWGDNTTQAWTSLSAENFDEYLLTGNGPQATYDPTTSTTATTSNVSAITRAIAAAMLAKPPPSCTDLFMKNKGGSDKIKSLKEPKHWNTWQCTFSSVAHSYNIMDITDPTYVPDPVDLDACTVFKLQQQHSFSLLVSIKESSTLPVVRKYSDPNATYYGDAQQLYQDLVAHYTQGLSGQQCLELLEKNLIDL